MSPVKIPHTEFGPRPGGNPGAHPVANPVANLSEIADWCEALARRVRAGDTLALALSDVGCSEALEPLIANLRLRIHRGTDLVMACTAMMESLDPHARSPEITALREALGVIRVCALGSPHTAHSLDRLARHFRVRVAITEQIHAQTAAARLSARLLTALPLAAVGLTITISPSSAGVFTTSAGLICLVLSLGLNAAGWLWIRSLVAAAGP
jgi:Flp pilus assembly protein TadB